MATRMHLKGPPVGKYAKDVRAFEQPLARAVTGAFRDGAKLIQAEGRAAILSGGLGPRFARQFRAFAFPRRQFSLSPAIRGWHARGWRNSRIGRYANIFAHGGTIVGRPLLWIPLPTAPKLAGGRHLTPALYVKEIGPLISMRGTRRPILAGQALRAVVGRRATVAQLRTGALNAAVRGGKASFLRAGRKGRRTVLVPIFVGVSSAHIDRRVNIDGVFARVNAQLPEMFAARMGGTTG
jgi:hypothetical protein